MNNTLEGINNRITEAEERISELEDKMVEITAEEQNKEKKTSSTSLVITDMEIEDRKSTRLNSSH